MTNPVETALRSDLKFRASQHALAQKTTAAWIEISNKVLLPVDRIVLWSVVAQLKQGFGLRHD